MILHKFCFVITYIYFLLRLALLSFMKNCADFTFEACNFLHILWSTSVKPKMYEKVWNQTPTRQTIGLASIVTTQDNRIAMGEKISDHNSETIEWLPLRSVQVFSWMNFQKWKRTIGEKTTSRFIHLCDFNDSRPSYFFNFYTFCLNVWIFLPNMVSINWVFLCRSSKLKENDQNKGGENMTKRKRLQKYNHPDTPRKISWNSIPYNVLSSFYGNNATFMVRVFYSIQFSDNPLQND